VVINLSVYLADYVIAPSLFGENISTAEFGMIFAETACWDIERNSQIFNENFY
jgi:hypothetical protein